MKWGGGRHGEGAGPRGPAGGEGNHSSNVKGEQERKWGAEEGARKPPEDPVAWRPLTMRSGSPTPGEGAFWRKSRDRRRQQLQKVLLGGISQRRAWVSLK